MLEFVQNKIILESEPRSFWFRKNTTSIGCLGGEAHTAHTYKIYALEKEKILIL